MSVSSAPRTDRNGSWACRPQPVPTNGSGLLFNVVGTVSLKAIVSKCCGPSGGMATREVLIVDARESEVPEKVTGPSLAALAASLISLPSVAS